MSKIELETSTTRRSQAVTFLTEPLNWKKQPENILIVKKANCSNLVIPFADIITWLINREKQVFVEPNIVHHDDIMNDRTVLDVLEKYIADKKVKEFSHKDHAQELDMVISLGGDGTVLHTSWLLQEATPPVMCFNFGIYGFLTPFEYFSFKDNLKSVFEGKYRILLRNRLICSYQSHDLEKQYVYVMNEVVVRRCLAPYAKNVLDLYIDGNRITFRGDGLIIATPTGSTAYACTTGASIIHPRVPAVLITPICSQKLSFRSILVPVTSRLKIIVSSRSRTTATLCCDGNFAKELTHGDSVWITHSENPFKTIVASRNVNNEWFTTLDCFLTSGGASNVVKDGDDSSSSSHDEQ